MAIVFLLGGCISSDTSEMERVKTSIMEYAESKGVSEEFFQIEIIDYNHAPNDSDIMKIKNRIDEIAVKLESQSLEYQTLTNEMNKLNEEGRHDELFQLIENNMHLGRQVDL